ncbi:MAG: hypothetical protein CBC38_07465 [Gammaproteobacteria bacterium TMED78]|nr:MAG: hypothetical protein CBC38_07465 [Gammaproteobacteria bacterium TMED78]
MNFPYISMTKPKLITLIFFLFLFTCPAFSQSFTHVHIRTPDPEATAQWYHTLFGGELRTFVGGMGSVAFTHGNIATMQDNGYASSIKNGVIDHFGFVVPNVADMLEKAETMGAKVEVQVSPGTISEQIAMFSDPWGARVELLEHPSFSGIHHVHLNTNNASQLKDWFLEIFGGQFHPQDNEQFNLIQYDGIWVHISESDLYVAPSRSSTLDHFGFSVNNMDNLVASIRDSGYEPYIIRPARPGSTTLLMFFEGLDGIHFEIAQSDAF